MAETCKVYQIGKAPKKIRLLGDKTKKVESTQHIIEFPGGAVEVCRLDNGDYWAHLIINRDDVIDDCEGRVSAFGSVVDSRIDYEHPAAPNIISIPAETAVRQIAVRIQPRKVK